MELQSYFKPPTFLLILFQASNCLQYHTKLKKRKAEKCKGVKEVWLWITLLNIVQQKEMTSGTNDPCDRPPKSQDVNLFFEGTYYVLQRTDVKKCMLSLD